MHPQEHALVVELDKLAAMQSAHPNPITQQWGNVIAAAARVVEVSDLPIVINVASVLASTGQLDQLAQLVSDKLMAGVVPDIETGGTPITDGTDQSGHTSSDTPATEPPVLGGD